MNQRTWFKNRLTREAITEGRFAKIAAEAERIGAFKALDPEVREANRREVLARVAPGEDVWIFAYGSLMWNPAFLHEENVTGRIYGYHRRFCLWSRIGRGSPECPGLILAIDRGGSCRGVAIRIAAENVAEETEIIWRREMIAGTYVPRWVDVRTARGLIPAVAFTVNRSHELYSGLLPFDETARHIARSEGQIGRCRDYLIDMVDHLDELGIPDRPMHELLRRVKRHADDG